MNKQQLANKIWAPAKKIASLKQIKSACLDKMFV